MSGAGMDRRTGRLLTGWAHVVQSLEVIFTTRIGSRVMRRTFGSAVPKLLGQNITNATMLRFFTALIVAVELWEPRFRIKQIASAGTNSPERVRTGRVGLRIVGEYRPNGHLGDPTPEGDRTVFLGGDGTLTQVQ